MGKVKWNDEFVYKWVIGFAFEKMFCDDIVDKVFFDFSLFMKC